jgi:tetratricopeptide (TPR) repeat protein
MAVSTSSYLRQTLSCGLVAIVAAVLMLLTFHRNRDCADEFSIWQDSARKAPWNWRPHYNLGVAFANQHEPDTAVAEYRKAIECKADCAEARYNLAVLLARQGETAEAIAQYEEVLRTQPDFSEAYNNLGSLRMQQGRVEDAVACYRQAIRWMPRFPEAHNNLGNALASRNQLEEAVAEYGEALDANPDYAEAHNNLGSLFGRQGRFAEAVAHFQRTLDIVPGHADAQRNLALALNHWNESPAARMDGHDSAGSSSAEVAMLNDIAWVMATSPDPSIRNGQRAVALAEQAIAIPAGRNVETLATLAAAYAETGRFPEAIEAANEALTLVEESNPALAQRIRTALAQYETGVPFRDTK